MDVLDLACQYFSVARVTGDARYLFHLPRQRKSFLGLGCHKIIRYQRDGFYIESSNGVVHHPAVDAPLAEMEDFLDKDFPSLWMISPDLCRAVDDPELPLLFCVQPRFEIELREFAASTEPLHLLPSVTGDGWETESDEEFLSRLHMAVATLQDYPSGKMIITRPYRKTVGYGDSLRLFESFARSEPAAACSHFLRLGTRICSLGCSPENVFELDYGRVAFDVVAATRGVSSDPEVDARWLAALQTDPKEQREHLMALERYRMRIEGLISPGSLTTERRLDVLQLGNVRHLYSRLSGQLKVNLNWMSLLLDSFPALTSYPEALQVLADNPGQPLRFYGGVLGRVGAGQQQAAFYLNLRAALIKDDVLFTQGGVGVIAESEPAKELREVKNKLSGLMKAVSAWESDSQG